VSLEDRSRVRYVMSPRSLAHLRDANFVLLPGWQDNP
jgi:hypothetical protein